MPVDKKDTNSFRIDGKRKAPKVTLWGFLFLILVMERFNSIG